MEWNVKVTIDNGSETEKAILGFREFFKDLLDFKWTFKYFGMLDFVSNLKNSK